MFLFMYSGNNHYPVNLQEQTLFEVIIPTSDYYQSNKKNVPENFRIVCSGKVNRKTDNRLQSTEKITCGMGYESMSTSLWDS